MCYIPSVRKNEKKPLLYLSPASALFFCSLLKIYIFFSSFFSKLHIFLFVNVKPKFIRCMRVFLGGGGGVVSKVIRHN